MIAVCIDFSDIALRSPAPTYAVSSPVTEVTGSCGPLCISQCWHEPSLSLYLHQINDMAVQNEKRKRRYCFRLDAIFLGNSVCDTFPNVLFFIKLCYTDGLLPTCLILNICVTDYVSLWQIINYSSSSFIAFPCNSLFFSGVISISISVLVFYFFFGSVQLENFTACLQTLSLPVQGLWPIHRRKKEI